MPALSRWRRKVKEKGLTQAEKDKDLRRSSNKEAFEEFKKKRAAQQRRRRQKNKNTKTTTKKQTRTGKKKTKFVQFVQVKKDEVQVFYVDMKYLKDIKIEKKVYSKKESEELMTKILLPMTNFKNSKQSKLSTHDLLLKTLSKKQKACRHESGGTKRVYASVIT